MATIEELKKIEDDKAYLKGLVAQASERYRELISQKLASAEEDFREYFASKGFTIEVGKSGTTAFYQGLRYTLKAVELVGAHMTLTALDNEFYILIGPFDAQGDSSRAHANPDLADQIISAESELAKPAQEMIYSARKKVSGPDERVRAATFAELLSTISP